MKIRGWQKVSTIDYPTHIATVLFTSGCNFRCPMCHNADLVLRPETLPIFSKDSEDEVEAFLKERAGKITGVVITGGEPTLQPDLPSFLRRMHGYGYAVKLDTNGYRPEVLAKLLDAGLLDYVAMDVKAPSRTYNQLAGLRYVDTGRITKSIRLLLEADVVREFRTTVVPGMLNGQDIASIAQWIAENMKPYHEPPRYVLQQFRPVNTLDPAMALREPYDAASLRIMRNQAGKHLPISRIKIRGIQ